jgi:hypothetical protein
VWHFCSFPQLSSLPGWTEPKSSRWIQFRDWYAVRRSCGRGGAELPPGAGDTHINDPSRSSPSLPSPKAPPTRHRPQLLAPPPQSPSAASAPISKRRHCLTSTAPICCSASAAARQSNRRRFRLIPRVAGASPPHGAPICWFYPETVSGSDSDEVCVLCPDCNPFPTSIATS